MQRQPDAHPSLPLSLTLSLQGRGNKNPPPVSQKRTEAIVAFAVAFLHLAQRPTAFQPNRHYTGAERYKKQ
jgi:hypothetical protein